MRFNHNGVFIAEWGNGYSSTVPFANFNVVTDVSVGQENARVYVADKLNGRVQVFDREGEPIEVFKNDLFNGGVESLCYSKGLILMLL